MIKYLTISIYFIDMIVEVVLIRNKAIAKRTEVFKNYTLATKMFNDLHESTKEPYYQTIC